MSCNCEGINDSLWELLDGDCSQERREEILAAIKQCPGCFEKYGIETEVRALVKQCCCQQAPSSLRESISIKIRRTQTTIVEFDS
ncbi:mycothiol system anti-sigma-R factor [Corynebacterium aquilae]|uniref:Putative zinc-finger domain-containing protein n=1 Tax=Corynebacterium aquilae DSM 44791 TaxID=1431546 RepID=A0A1L7CEF1_9CORY|nr:mycothiol system anti-sigma-R factor [Corynebacterium aquilae]APT84207.1 hypothetical protein CAQU_02980 [Corynebacterium aquilae DSM 44791]